MPGRSGLFAVAILLALSAGMTMPADAEQKKPGGLSVKDKQGICDAKWITCLDGCDDLIDIGDAVASCQRRCDRRHNTCLKRAQTLEVPEIGIDNGVSSPGLTRAP